MPTSDDYKILADLPSTDTMPLIFVGHGSPMNAITDNAFTRGWVAVGESIPRPQAILCISAHWLTPGSTQVTAMDVPKTIHDFGGFPKELFEQEYPAPGTPEYAAKTIELIRKTEVIADYTWGLDHGTWSVLTKMFPEADVPTYQLSMDWAQEPRYHYELARELKALRDKGVLIIGSGNLVHNLQRLEMDGEPFDWAVEFDQKMTALLDDRNDDEIVDFLKLGELTKLAHPTHEHFLPMMYALGLKDPTEEIEYFNDEFVMSSISMRSFVARAKGV